MSFQAGALRIAVNKGKGARAMATEAYPRCALCPVKLCENRGAPADGELPSLEEAPPFTCFSEHEGFTAGE